MGEGWVRKKPLKSDGVLKLGDGYVDMQYIILSAFV